MFRRVCRFSFLLVLISLLGCGSSSGGGNGTGDPIEIEVGAVIDAFVAEIEQLDAQKVSEDRLDANGTYYRKALDNPESMGTLTGRLYSFFAKIKPNSLTFQIENRYIESIGENGAQMMADLTVTYTPNGSDNPVTIPSERLYLRLERAEKWGITSFGSLEYPTSFPPQL